MKYIPQTYSLIIPNIIDGHDLIDFSCIFFALPFVKKNIFKSVCIYLPLQKCATPGALEIMNWSHSCCFCNLFLTSYLISKNNKWWSVSLIQQKVKNEHHYKNTIMKKKYICTIDHTKRTQIKLYQLPVCDWVCYDIIFNLQFKHLKILLLVDW